MSLFKAAEKTEIPEGSMKVFNIEGKEVLIINIEDTFYAIGAKCTHMGGDLSKGAIDQKTIKCPRHGAIYDIATGESLSGPRMGPLKLKTKDLVKYNIKIENENIFIEII